MIRHHAAPAPCTPGILPALHAIVTPVRRLNETLWTLIAKPGPLTPEEWAYFEEVERQLG